MKFRILGIFGLLVGVIFLIIGCPSKSSSPSSPAPAAPTSTNTFTVTNTPCTDGSGHTCTFTFTATPSNTATLTPTSTPSNTSTSTASFTVTNTLTNSATSTNTGTPTNSATVTPTATITNTPTITATATITDTPTNSGTPTPTGTPTATSQYTLTKTPTGTPTATATATITGVVFSGSVSYSGSFATSPGVNAGHSISVEVYTNSGLIAGNNGVSIAGAATVTSNGGSFSITLTSPGTYYVLANYDYNGKTGVFGLVDQTGPFPAEPYAIVSGNGNTSSQLPAPGITFSSGVTSFTNTIIFGDQNVAQGITGGVTFLGSGPVSSSNYIHVLAYLSGTNYGTLMTEALVPKNGGTYNLTDLTNNNNGSDYDLVAFYDAVGNAVVNATPVPGTDPVTYLNDIPVSVIAVGTPTSQALVTIPSATGGTYPAPMTLSVNINTTSYPVNSTHQLGWLLSTGFGSGNNYQVIDAQSNANNAVITDTTTTNYYIGLIYGLSGAGYPSGTNPLTVNPHVGDIYQFFNYSGNSANGEGCFGTYSSANVTNPSGGVSLNATFPYPSTQPCTFTGVGGTFNYTGAGTVSSSDQLAVGIFSDSAYTQNVGSNSYSTNNGRYDMVDFTGGVPSTYYLEAWYQSTGGSCNNNNSPCIGNPVTQLGAFTQGTVNNLNITLNSSNTYQGITLGGTLNWSGAVSLYVASYDNNGNFEALSGLVANGGTYAVDAIPGNNNYLVAINDLNGLGQSAILSALQNYNPGSISGDGWAVYDNSTCTNGFTTQTIQGGTGITTTTNDTSVNWTVSTSCSF